MSLFGLFKNEPKETTNREDDGIVCPSTGHRFKTWKEYGEATDPYSIGEQYGRKQLIVFPDLDDYLDCHAAMHVKRAVETHGNVVSIFHMVDEVDKKIDKLLEQNQQILERLDKLEHKLENTSEFSR